MFNKQVLLVSIDECSTVAKVCHIPLDVAALPIVSHQPVHIELADYPFRIVIIRCIIMKFIYTHI